jgi:hypothetical protein
LVFRYSCRASTLRRGEILLSDIRQIPGGFDARIALLNDLSNGQQRSSRPPATLCCPESLLEVNPLFAYQGIIKFLAGIIKLGCPVMPYLPDMERKTANIDIRVRAPAGREHRRLALEAARTAEPNCGDRLHDRAIPQA